MDNLTSLKSILKEKCKDTKLTFENIIEIEKNIKNQMINNKKMSL